MGTPVSKNMVEPIRPEQIVYFKLISDITKRSHAFIKESVPEQLRSKPVRSYHTSIFKWSPTQGYIIYVKNNEDIDDSIDTVFEISSIDDIKLMFPDAALNRLTKLTRHNYLADQQYTLKHHNAGICEIIYPIHWTIEMLFGLIKDGDVIYDIDFEYVAGIGIRFTRSFTDITIEN